MGIIIMIILILNGCTKKEDPIQDPIVSGGKQIVSFKIVAPAATAVIDTVAKTIMISVPTGTSLTSLVTDISLAPSYTISPASGAPQNFTNPVVYTVTRGTTNTTWTVSVTAPLSAGKQINYFKIVTPAATGVIDTTAKTIAISVPVGTSLTSLTTDISLAAGYTISPASGVARDFTNTVTYTVTRAGSTSGTNWAVTVKILYPVLSPGKQMIYFKFVTPAVTGTIDTVAKTITLPVSAGTSVTSLVTDISIAPGYAISPVSGAAKDFTNPVTYTVSRTGQTNVVWTVSASSPLVTVSQNIATSTTWTSDKVYLVTGDRYLTNGATLTIQPGTLIKFDAGASLSIGYYGNATLIANGTAAAPIIFTSSATSPTAGAWEGIYFEDASISSSLAYCNIQYAGYNTGYGAVNLLGSDVAINNCNITNSGSYGIYTTYASNKGGFVSYANNTINTTSKYGIVISAQTLSTIGTGNTFTNSKGILITGSYNNNNAQTWRNLNVPYIVDHELMVDGNLTIEPGTTFKFEVNGHITMGYYSSTTFVADGTAALPITFTSNATSPTSGAWPGVTFDDNTLSNTKMNYCIIDYAGSNSGNGAVNLYSVSIIFTNNIIRNSASYGIYMNFDAGFQTFNNNTINTCTNHLIYISVKHLPDLGTPNTLTAATGKGINIYGDYQYTTAVTWKKQTADFYVTGGSCDLDGDITIEAGSKFLFVNDSYFYFGYYASTKVTAIGTSVNKITFTSAASSPVAGAWKGLVFDDNVLSNTALTYCTLQYTGLTNSAGIRAWAPFAVNNTTISDFSLTSNAAEYRGTMPTGGGNNFGWVTF